MQTLSVRIHNDDIKFLDKAVTMLNRGLTQMAQTVVLKQSKVNEHSWEVEFMFFDPTALLSIGKLIGVAQMWEVIYEQEYPFTTTEQL